MRAPTAVLALSALIVPAAAPAPALAWSEPPVQGPRDAACRDEARANVFTAPDPQGLGLFENGKRIYLACMARAGGGRREAKAGAR